MHTARRERFFCCAAPPAHVPLNREAALLDSIRQHTYNFIAQSVTRSYRRHDRMTSLIVQQTVIELLVVFQWEHCIL